jgi:hypothetical protein
MPRLALSGKPQRDSSLLAVILGAEELKGKSCLD